MAKKQDDKSKITLERTYVVPIRRDILKAPKYRRAKRAVSSVRDFLKQHMKSEDVKLDDSINKKLWENGIKNPPGKIRVNVTKDSSGTVTATLFGTTKKIVEEKKPAKKKERIEDKIEKEASVEEKVTEEKKASKKTAEKTTTKE